MYLRQMREMLEVLGELTTDSISPQAEAELLAAFRDWKTGNGASGYVVRSAPAALRGAYGRIEGRECSAAGAPPLRARRRCPARSSGALRARSATRSAGGAAERRSSPRLEGVGPTFDASGSTHAASNSGETRAIAPPGRHTTLSRDATPRPTGSMPRP